METKHHWEPLECPEAMWLSHQLELGVLDLGILAERKLRWARWTQSSFPCFQAHGFHLSAESALASNILFMIQPTLCATAFEIICVSTLGGQVLEGNATALEDEHAQLPVCSHLLWDGFSLCQSSRVLKGLIYTGYSPGPRPRVGDEMSPHLSSMSHTHLHTPIKSSQLQKLYNEDCWLGGSAFLLQVMVLSISLVTSAWEDMHLSIYMNNSGNPKIQTFWCLLYGCEKRSEVISRSGSMSCTLLRKCSLVKRVGGKLLASGSWKPGFPSS